jgi:hypothetical protein
MGRNHLRSRHGYAANAIRAAVGYNLRRLIRCFGFLRLFLTAIFPSLLTHPA